MKPTLKKVSKYENKFAKLQKKAAEFNFRNQLKQVKKKEFTLEEEDKEVRVIVVDRECASARREFLRIIFSLACRGLSMRAPLEFVGIETIPRGYKSPRSLVVCLAFTSIWHSAIYDLSATAPLLPRILTCLDETRFLQGAQIIGDRTTGR